MAEAYLGEIRLFSGLKPPAGFLPCDGRYLSISENQALYSLIGFTWGGSQSKGFAIPDLRGRVLVGQGTGTKLTPRALAATGGTETVTVDQSQLPSHTHALMVEPAVATSPTPGPTVLPAALAAPLVGYISDAKQTGTFDFNPAMVQSAGGNGDHTNIMPVLALTYIIAVQGLYPQPAS